MGTEMAGLPGRRLMLVYYLVTALVGLGTLWGDPGQPTVAAFGGRGWGLHAFGAGYFLFGVFGFVARWRQLGHSELVAVRVITVLSGIHGAALIAQGAWISGGRLLNAVLMMAVWVVMHQMLSTTIPRGETWNLGSPPPGSSARSSQESSPDI